MKIIGLTFSETKISKTRDQGGIEPGTSSTTIKYTNHSSYWPTPVHRHARDDSWGFISYLF